MSICKPCPTVFFDDFSNGVIPGAPGSPFTFFNVGPPYGVANDAAGGVTAGPDGLEVESTPFTHTVSNGLDHVKYLVFNENNFIAPDTGELAYETRLAGQQTGLSPVPAVLRALTPDSTDGVNNVNSDCRLSASAMITIDFATMMVFDFFVTNEDIYALYERLPFLRTEWGGPGPNYLAFTHLVPIGKRNAADPLDDFTTLSVGYNKSQGYVRWSINGEEKFRVNRIGLPIERKYRVLEETIPNAQLDPATVVVPQSLSFGFGTFSLFDATNPQNPGQINNRGLVDLTAGIFPFANPIVTNVDGTSIPATFISPYPLAGANGTNYGQGNILRLKSFKVSHIV